MLGLKLIHVKKRGALEGKATTKCLDENLPERVYYSKGYVFFITVHLSAPYQLL